MTLIKDMSLDQVEKHLLQASRDQRDLYRLEAAELFSVRYEDVTAEQRAFAKQYVHMNAYSGGRPCSKGS